MKIDNLSFAYGENVIFKDLNIDFPQGVTCIMGGSGAGKTTLLNCISNQLKYHGNISYDKGSENIAYVFQQPRLIPSMSVEENIKYVLPKSLTKDEIKARVDDIIDKLQLKDCRAAYPKNISGGQSGRTALARALVTDCDLLLMDEPFKGLDIKLKKDILNLLIPLIKNKNVLFVTHDVEEALAIADRAIVLERKDNECVNIKGQIDIAQSQESRDVYGQEFNELRKDLYQLLMKN